MKEEIVFQRRNRLKNHFVNTSKVLLYGYKEVSDGAKITYQVIDGFDWEDKETGNSKGYVFPAIATLANIRRTTVRTIHRHIKELEEAKLLTRKRRQSLPSILIIEDLSKKEIKTYLDEYVASENNQKNRPKKKSAKKLSTKKWKKLRPKSQELRNDIFVVSDSEPETTKMSFANKVRKEKEVYYEENEIIVNDNLQIVRQKRNGQTSSIGDLLKSYHLPALQKTGKSDQNLQRDMVAEQLSNDLNDQKSLGCYRVIVDKVPHPIIFQNLGRVKEAARAGQIRQSKGAFFVELIKDYSEHHGIELGFQTLTRAP
jgi:DNA-binding MarR family transcriptional regulator